MAAQAMGRWSTAPEAFSPLAHSLRKLALDREPTVGRGRARRTSNRRGARGQRQATFAFARGRAQVGVAPRSYVCDSCPDLTRFTVRFGGRRGPRSWRPARLNGYLDHPEPGQRAAGPCARRNVVLVVRAGQATWSFLRRSPRFPARIDDTATSKLSTPTRWPVRRLRDAGLREIGEVRLTARRPACGRQVVSDPEAGPTESRAAGKFQ